MAGTAPGKDEPRDALAPEDRALLERLARWLVERRLAVPAVLFLESARPLSFVGSQALYFFEPMVKAFLSAKDYTRVARLLEDRANLDAFLRIVEAREERGREAEREEKRRAREGERAGTERRTDRHEEPR